MNQGRVSTVFFDDELLSSWLLRQCLNDARLGKDFVAYDLFLKRILVNSTCESLDVDRYYSDEILTAIHSYFGAVNFNAPLAVSESGAWVLNGVYHRTAFCPFCIREHLESYNVIFWKKCWSNGWYTMCEQHEFPLINLQEPLSNYESLKCRVGDAFSIACEEHWIDKRFANVADVAPLGNYRACIISEGGRPEKAAIQYSLASIAWIMQGYMVRHRRLGQGRGLVFEDFAIDLIRVAMRKYFKRFESPPLASELTRLLGYSKDLRSVFEYRSHRDGSPDPECAADWLQSGTLVQNAEQVSSVQSRMMAIALVGVLLDLEGSRPHWHDIVLNARSLGWTLPLRPEEIFEAMVVDTRWDVRKWMAKRAKSYNPISQSLCERFL